MGESEIYNAQKKSIYIFYKNNVFKLVIANIVNCHISSHHLGKDSSIGRRTKGEGWASGEKMMGNVNIVQSKNFF